MKSSDLKVKVNEGLGVSDFARLLEYGSVCLFRW